MTSSSKRTELWNSIACKTVCFLTHEGRKAILLSFSRFSFRLFNDPSASKGRSNAYNRILSTSALQCVWIALVWVEKTDIAFPLRMLHRIKDQIWWQMLECSHVFMWAWLWWDRCLGSSIHFAFLNARHCSVIVCDYSFVDMTKPVFIICTVWYVAPWMFNTFAIDIMENSLNVCL